MLLVHTVASVDPLLSSIIRSLNWWQQSSDIFDITCTFLLSALLDWRQSYSVIFVDISSGQVHYEDATR